MSEIVECACDRGGEYDAEQYSSCYTCYLERRSEYMTCILCGSNWHSPKFDCCFKCRMSAPGRDNAARDLRLDILVRDEFTCRDCAEGYPGGSQDLQVDHIKPCLASGLATPWNLQVLCGKHNREKGGYWEPGCEWDSTRVLLMHMYFTFGWGLLDDEQREQLRDDADIYGDEFVWHARFIDEDFDPPSWALEMADAESVLQQEIA
jgi:5-methylcytosine-specific restriction endonuclease McrA